MTLLARTDGNPRTALSALQAALDTVGPGLVGFFPRTMDDHLAIQLLPTRTAARAATALGILALVLSAVGLYGLVSWLVELRRPEIGVRMALGASAGDVSRLIVRTAMAAALPGLVAGVGAAIGLGALARSALFGVGPVDPVALTIGIITVVAAVVVASVVPSRRAARVDPAIAFRQ
jgi:ABC-type antimicrobial peptide transport system permease subunit